MSPDTTQLNWYVVRTYSGHEKKVKEYLEREIAEKNLGDKIQEILIPTETVVEIRNGKKKTREKNFFPGYMLIATIFDDTVNELISNAPSVIGFLKPGKSAKEPPTPLRQDEVNRILNRVNHNRDVVSSGGVVDIPFRKGDFVKVTDGPFKGFDGTVEEVYPDKLKLRVLVSIFGRKTPVEVDINQVEIEA
jgi:transcriptional antiterminator NusG